jgi:hypothetical protein
LPDPPRAIHNSALGHFYIHFSPEEAAMFGSVTLDVMIGIMLIFFMLSIVCSACVEMIAAKWRWRNENFRHALTKLLEGDATTEVITKEFLSSPVVLPMVYGADSAGDGTPSYMAANTFSEAILAMICAQRSDGPGGVGFAQLRHVLRAKADASPCINFEMPDAAHLRQVLRAFVDSVERTIPDGSADADVQR